jgi:hypothetical protein
MQVFDNLTKGTAQNRMDETLSRKAAEECSPQRKLWVGKRELRSPGRGERTVRPTRTQFYEFQKGTIDPP